MIRQLIMMLLRGYKLAISPLFPPACRYVPTCSEYALQAVELHGPVRGSLIALWRLLRCHPFSRGGYDPVARRRECGVESPSATTEFHRPCSG